MLSVHAHKESVLGLYLSNDGNLLFSSGGDSVVNVSHSAKHLANDINCVRYGPQGHLNASTQSIPIMMWATFSQWFIPQITKLSTAVPRTQVSRYATLSSFHAKLLTWTVV